MIDIAQSPFLQALGLAIANSLWQAALLWLLYFICTQVAKPKANKKYLIANTATLLSLLWFVYNVFFYYSELTSIVSSSKQPDYTIMDVTSTSIFGIGIRYAQALIPYLSCAYMLVAALLAMRLFNGFKEVKTLRTTQLQKAPVAWRLYVKKYAVILQIDKTVEVWLSAKVNSPLTIGFWKPIILLPLAGINHLSPQQVEAILLHELAHIRRYDYLVNILLQIAEILLFFNPFVRLLLKQAYQERENCCDDWVLQFNYNGTEYARALLSIEQTAQSHLLALGVNNHSKYYLLKRIKRMVSPEKKPTDYRTQLSTLAFVMLTMLLMNGFVPAITVKQHAPKVMGMTNADFFSPSVQMKASVIDEIEAAAKAFSRARFNGTKAGIAETKNKAAENLTMEQNAVINMVTEEEAAEIAMAASEQSILYRQANESMLAPAVFEIDKQNSESSSSNIQLLENVLHENQVAGLTQLIENRFRITEKEIKATSANMENAQQKLRSHELELQQLLSSFAQENWLISTDDQLKLAREQKEKAIAAAAERYASVLAEIQEQKYSFSYEVNTSPTSEQRFGTGIRFPDTRVSNSSKKLTVNTKTVVRSKDNKHITINLSGNEKEMSICLPADTREAALETIKQLEKIGVLVIERTSASKPSFSKKPRVVVSL